MTLDDAIKHCYKKAEELREQDGCLECAHEHEELAGWLEELKKRRENDRPKGKWILKETDYDDGGNNLYECDNCHHSDIHSGSIEVPYCWHCGAEMREDADNE